MNKYFVDASGRCQGECSSDTPVNPDGLDIITHEEVAGSPFDYVFDSGALVYSPTNPPTHAEVIQSFKDAIQMTLDDAARAKGYDDIVSACSYAGYENVFQAEAIAFGVWRANVWAYGYQELAKVTAGTRPVPTVPEIIAELPALVLP